MLLLQLVIFINISCKCLIFKNKTKNFPGKTSWIAEYRRLIEEIPLVECECLEEHYHQVLHVSFSHNGEMFATTSKDGFVVVRSYYYRKISFQDYQFFIIIIRLIQTCLFI